MRFRAGNYVKINCPEHKELCHGRIGIIKRFYNRNAMITFPGNTHNVLTTNKKELTLSSKEEYEAQLVIDVL